MLPADPPGPVVVVVPAHLKETWRRQAWEHAGVRAEVLYHNRRPADRQPPSDPNALLLVNYDILTPDEWRPDTAPAADSWVVWLASLRPRFLVGDEGHMLSNPDSQRSRGFQWLARRTPRTTILTGTPLPNKPADLWGPLNTLWPHEFPSRWEFGTRYSHPHKDRGRWTYRGARNLDELHAKLNRLGMIRRRKADVLADLPAVFYELVPLGGDRGEYRRAEADVVAWLTQQNALAGERAGRAAELARMATLLQLAAESKMDDVVRWVQSFLAESDGKLLLGAIHYRVTGILMEALGRQAVLVDGRVSERNKTAAFDAFNRDANIRVLVGNLHAAGTGWSCTSTSDVAFVELPWRPADVTQFAGRVHGVARGVAGRNAHVRFLVATDTLEERLCEGIQRKQLWAARAVDGDPGVADLDLYDQVRAALG